MKKLIIILLAAILLTGCSNTEKKPIEMPTGGEQPSPETQQDAKCLYTVIVPSDCSARVRASANRLTARLVSDTSVAIKSKSDRLSEGESADGVSEYEILLGNTNRSASSVNSELAGDGGWWVGMVGSRVVINGKSADALDAAVDYFLEKYKFSDKKIFVEEKDFKVESKTDALLAADIGLRVGTYNIRNGADVDHDFSVIAADITALGLDIVGLQEVDLNTRRNGRQDTAKKLAQLCGYGYYSFAKAMDFDGGEYGTAILSRYPIISFDVISLTNDGDCEPRALGHAVISVEGVRIDYYNTHLSFESDSLRAEQYGDIAEQLKGKTAYILTADFNCARPNELSVFEDTVRVSGGKYLTCESKYAIDDIVLDHGWRIEKSGMAVTNHSDHNLLWADIRYTAGL